MMMSQAIRICPVCGSHFIGTKTVVYTLGIEDEVIEQRKGWEIAVKNPPQLPPGYAQSTVLVCQGCKTEWSV